MTYDQVLLIFVLAGAAAGGLSFLMATFSVRDSRDAVNFATEALQRAADAERTAALARSLASKPPGGRLTAMPIVQPAAPSRHDVERTEAFAAYKPRKTPEQAEKAFARLTAHRDERIVPLRVRPGGPPAAVVMTTPPTLLDAALARGRSVDESDWTGERAGANA